MSLIYNKLQFCQWRNQGPRPFKEIYWKLWMYGLVINGCRFKDVCHWSQEELGWRVGPWRFILTIGFITQSPSTSCIPHTKQWIRTLTLTEEQKQVFIWGIYWAASVSWRENRLWNSWDLSSNLNSFSHRMYKIEQCAMPPSVSLPICKTGLIVFTVHKFWKKQK